MTQDGQGDQWYCGVYENHTERELHQTGGEDSLGTCVRGGTGWEELHQTGGEGSLGTCVRGGTGWAELHQTGGEDSQTVPSGITSFLSQFLSKLWRNFYRKKLGDHGDTLLK